MVAAMCGRQTVVVGGLIVVAELQLEAQMKSPVPG